MGRYLGCATVFPRQVREADKRNMLGGSISISLERRISQCGTADVLDVSWREVWQKGREDKYVICYGAAEGIVRLGGLEVG